MEDAARKQPASRATFLEGGGQLAALMRGKDWSDTPLGPLEGWPQSLLTAVSVMLTAPQPSYVFWGPDLAILYNDRGLPFVGLKHPDCLGHSIRTVLAEAWPVLGPLVEGVMSTGQPVYLENLFIPLDRMGFLQDGYFTFSYIPIRNEAAEIGGILVIVNETTAQVLGDRRLVLIRELSLRAALCQTVTGVLQAAEDVLAQAPSDVPFALLYELRGGRADLVVSAGLERGHPAAPLTVELAHDGPWPLAAVRDGGERMVEGLATRVPPLPGGPWEEAGQRAFVLPIPGAPEGQASHILVAGLNPRHVLDDDARAFLQLLGRQVAASIASTQALQEKTQRAAQLAELDRQKTEFFSNVSHEFRTPLTLMLGPVEHALEHGVGLGGDTLASVHRNALRLLKLVNNLLDFSRVEAGRARASFRPVDLALLTTDLASGFRSVIESAGMTLEISCDDLAGPAYVDADMWEKIVLNLLSNAYKFTFAGRIGVELRRDGDDVVLSVSDTGVGIPSDHVPRLFDRFHRVEGTRSRTHEGSGIGLALVAELARLHGGGVDVSSRVGEGTTFTVTIPRGSAAASAQEADGPRVSTATKRAAYVEEAVRWGGGMAKPDGVVGEPAAAAKLDSVAGEPVAAAKQDGAADEPVAAEAPEIRKARARRVLVAEDNADMRDYLSRLLSERWTVETASDGEQALAHAVAHPPDVIVSDMMMPGLDGIALVRALRRDERTREVPFILLSARAGQEATTHALEQGASDYMVKPFAARELMARVGAQLEIANVQRQARQRVESFLMEAPAAMAVLRGPRLVYVLANERYCRLVGHQALVGKAGREAVPELAAQGVWDLVERVYTTGEPYVSTGFEAKFATGDGGALEQGFYDWVAQPTRGLDGAVDGVMIFVVDVTVQVRARQTEAALRGEAEAASRAARDANRAKDEFLAMLGHELRNPLAPIATALQIMRLRDVGSEKERSVIERQVGHLEGLVSDLLDVSRITQGKVDLKRAPVEVSTLIAEAIEMASPLLEQRRHHLDVRVPASGLLVDGDAGRLRQVFANLITNAAKYTEPNGHITIEAEARGDRAVVTVKDDGIGISEDMLRRIFDTFSQIPQSLERSQGGLGLGLSIVRGLVELHGGRVRADSAGEGCGSTFVVELPLAALGAAAADASPSSEASTARATHGERILVVDDNEDAAHLLADLLRAIGHDAEVAHDGPSALEMACGFRPTVALLDIGLPVMDGYELARRLHSDPILQNVRLIAVTGYGQMEDRRRSKEAGFASHLVKPIHLEDLTEVLGTGGRAPV